MLNFTPFHLLEDVKRAKKNFTNYSILQTFHFFFFYSKIFFISIPYSLLVHPHPSPPPPHPPPTFVFISSFIFLYSLQLSLFSTFSPNNIFVFFPPNIYNSFTDSAMLYTIQFTYRIYSFPFLKVGKKNQVRSL